MSWFCFYFEYDLHRENPRGRYKTVVRAKHRDAKTSKGKAGAIRETGWWKRKTEEERQEECMGIKRGFCDMEENERDSSFARKEKEKKIRRIPNNIRATWCHVHHGNPDSLFFFLKMSSRAYVDTWWSRFACLVSLRKRLEYHIYASMWMSLIVGKLIKNIF